MEIENYSKEPNYPSKRINELTYDYIRNDYYTDENGQRYRAPTLHTRFREVQSASHLKRAINFFIDTIIILPISYLLVFPIGYLIPDKIFKEIIPFIAFICLLISSMLYYVISEYKFQQTLGKYLTGTKVIDAYALIPTLKQIILRTFYRTLTFGLEFLYFWDYMNSSTFCRGMHDRNTNTWVIPKEELLVLHQLLQEQNSTNC